ncbi:MAG: CotH kinase family protein [Flavobacteriales bacterium]
MKYRIVILLVLTILTVTCTKREAVFESDISADYELTLILRFNGKDCLLDAEKNLLKYSLAENEVTNFSPTVEFQNYSEVRFGSRLLDNNTTNPLGDIILHKKYEVEITTNGEVKKFKLIFTETPLIQIISHDKIRNEPKILARIKLNYPEIGKPTADSYVGIEIRGKSSARLPKKSYGLRPLSDKNMGEFKSLPFFDFAKNDKWSLDAMEIEKSKVRNKTSFEVWKSINPISIESEYVEVFINNNSEGLYRFSQNYTDELLGMGSGASLFVGIDNSKYTKFREMPDEKPLSMFWEDWEQEFPDPKQNLEWDDFYDFVKVATSEDDQVFETQIENHLNLDKVIDYYLFVCLIYGADNAGKNWFFMKKNALSKFEILPWDLDGTWGRSASGNEQTPDRQVVNQLFERLVSVNPNQYVSKLKARWIALRANQFSETEIINKFSANFAEVISISTELSKLEAENQYTVIQNEQVYVNNWVNARLTYLDNYIRNR